ncbi:MAG: hypothetical protein QGG31_02645, partial [Anaerolineales bacterium]|nr:hypothetical protein [Anaerolineales bacterium]
MAVEAPLAARMRPRSLEEFVGQREIIGRGRLLRRAIEADKLFSSILLWGPPGLLWGLLGLLWDPLGLLWGLLGLLWDPLGLLWGPMA